MTGSRAVAACLVLAGGLTGCGGDDTTTGKPLHAAANFDPTIAGYVACSSTILEGVVVRVVDGAPGRMLATLTVDHWVKPANGPGQVRLNLVDIAKDGVYGRWPAGKHLLLAVDVDPSVLPSWQFRSSEFDRLEAALPEAASLSCPYGPT